MEFEEMKKIWDTQTNRPLYVINEDALHNRIRSKLRSSVRMNDTNDFGLILVALVTSVILLLIQGLSIWNIITSAVLILVAVYVLVSRMGRIKQEQQFDRSMLGELGHAISGIDYEIRRSRTIMWWFILPVTIPAAIKLFQSDATLWQMFIVPAAFVLSLLVIQWGLKNSLIPKRRHLESLQQKITEDNQAAI